MAMFSKAVRPAYTAGPSMRHPMWVRARQRPLSPSWPKMETAPDVGWDRPHMMRMSVVLPAPFLPTRP